MRIFHRFFLIILVSVSGIASTRVSASPVSIDFSPFEENGKFGIKNKNGDILIPAEYDELGWSNKSFSMIEGVTGYRSGDKWGLISLQNQKLTSAEYDELFPGDGTVLIVKKKLPQGTFLMTGCVDVHGKRLVPLQYDEIRVNSMRAIVSRRNGSVLRQGLVDLTNTVLIPINYLRIYPLGSLRYAVVSKENKTAIFSDNGTQLTDFSIDSISSFKKDFAVVYQGFHQGVINRKGEFIVAPEFRDVEITADGKIKTRKFDQWIFLEGANKERKRFFADSISSLNGGLYKTKIGSAYFIGNEQLKPVNDLVFSHLSDFKEGKAIFKHHDKAGIILENGTQLVAANYINITRRENYFIAFDQKHKYSLLDSAGKVLSRKGYDEIGDMTGSLWPVKYKNYWGALDHTGKEIIACVHDSLIHSLDNLVVVKFKGLYGIINKNEDWIVTPQSHALKILTPNRYQTSVNGTNFLKSLDGEIVYFTTNKVDFKDGKFLLEYLQDGSVIRITMNGQVDRMETTPGIQNILPESEGYRAIRRDGKFGFIDSRSRLRIANRYDDVKAFSDGMAAIKLLGKWGFIDKEDQIVVQPVYDEVQSFHNGYARVKQKNFYGVIDKTGKVIVPVRYDKLDILESGRYQVTQNGELGLLNRHGQFIINVKYTHLVDLNNGFVMVERDRKWGVITTEGISTIPMIFDGMEYDERSKSFVALKKSEWEERVN